MDFGDGSKDYESKETPLNLVMQFLHDSGYSNALKALETESGEEFSVQAIAMGGRLLAILDEHKTLKSFSDLSVEDKDEAEALLVPGDGIFIKESYKTFEALHRSNILALRFSPDPDSSLIATGSTDKTVKITNFNTGVTKFVFDSHTGPVSKTRTFLLISYTQIGLIIEILSLDFNLKNPALLLSSGMDGAVCLFDVNQGQLIHKFPSHAKVKWSPDGTRFASASYDKTVRLYEKNESNPQEPYILVTSLSFLGNPEAIAFHPDGTQLIVAIREDNYLHYIDLESPHEKTKVNMNANGDNHVSFSVLDVAISPDGKYTLVSTDKDRLILFKLGASEHIRTFYGASNDTYSQPRCCFSPSGKYVYSTSQDNKIYVWDLATQKIVTKLHAHSALVRDIHFQPEENILASASFDKTVVLWQ